MSGGYTPPNRDEIDWLLREIRNIKQQVLELARPTGTQLAGAVEKIRLLVNDLAAQVNALAASGVEWKGPVNTTGNVTAGGRVTSAVALRSPGSRAYVVSTGYAGAWIDGDGTVGISPSSRRFKTDIEDWQTDIKQLLNLRAVMFRYDFGWADPTAPKQLGFIAEELEELGFTEFLFYDADGLVEGINYDRLTVALVALAQWQEMRLQSVETRLSAAGL